MASCCPPRREALFVDQEEGCGLELSPVEDGMLVMKVCEFPGQRGLQAGDIIAAIDGTPLAARTCGGADGQEDTFGESMRHGAELDVIEGFGEPADTVRFRCPRCWRGFSSWQSCLQHHLSVWRAETSDASAQPPADIIREWMNRAVAATRGELPRPATPASKPMGIAVPPAAPPLPVFAQLPMMPDASSQPAGSSADAAREARAARRRRQLRGAVWRGGADAPCPEHSSERGLQNPQEPAQGERMAGSAEELEEPKQSGGDSAGSSDSEVFLMDRPMLEGVGLGVGATPSRAADTAGFRAEGSVGDAEAAVQEHGRHTADVAVSSPSVGRVPEPFKFSPQQRQPDSATPPGVEALDPSCVSSAAAAPVEVLKPGALVVVHSLKKSAELNGRLAHCLQWIEESSRWRIRLDNGEQKDVRPDNLTLQASRTVETQDAGSALSAPFAASAPSVPATPGTAPNAVRTAPKPDVPRASGTARTGSAAKGCSTPSAPHATCTPGTSPSSSTPSPASLPGVASASSMQSASSKLSAAGLLKRTKVSNSSVNVDAGAQPAKHEPRTLGRVHCSDAPRTGVDESVASATPAAKGRLFRTTRRTAKSTKISPPSHQVGTESGSRTESWGSSSASRSPLSPKSQAQTLLPPPPTRSWWAQFFELRRLRMQGAAVLKVSLSRMRVRDVDMRSLVAAIDLLLDDLRSELTTKDSQRGCAVLRVVLELDLSENELGDAGVVCLLQWLLSRIPEVRCRVLRLARNSLGDISLVWLAEVVRKQHAAFEEVHLSRNRATAYGAAALLMAIALHPSEAYPWLNRRGFFIPVFIGLDRNVVNDPSTLLARLRLRAGLRADEAESCTAQLRRFSAAPHVHVPGLVQGALAVSQSDPERLPAELLECIEQVCAGGKWSLPPVPGISNDASHGMLTVGAMLPTPGGPHPRSSTIREELFVDEDIGAGLQLEPVDDGLQICEIDDFPGQPRLRHGDVIVAVDGWPLLASMCPGDDEQNSRFGQYFRHGARLDIMRSVNGRGQLQATCRSGQWTNAATGDARFRCPRCWEGFNAWSPCLKHLREAGHGPHKDSGGPLEDEAQCIRRWMAVCGAAARGELPEPPRLVGAATVREVVESLLLPVALLGQERCPSMLESLAVDAVSCGDRHSCAVWLREDGFEARGSKRSAAVSTMEELRDMLQFYLPELEAAPAPPVPGRARKPTSQMPDPSATSSLPSADEMPADWAWWLQCMAEQQDDGGDLADSDGDAGGDAAAGVGAPLNAAAPPFVPHGVACSASCLRILVLCGLPGSGKSTLAEELRSEQGWEVVNQDTLGSRQACMKAARHALRKPGGRVLIDRCNIDGSQRSVWVQLAMQEFGLGALELGCVWLDAPVEECDRRVLSRFGHKTLLPDASSLPVIRGFAEAWRPPMTVEGFARIWRLASPLDFEIFWAEVRAGEETVAKGLGGKALPTEEAGGVDARRGKPSKHSALAWLEGADEDETSEQKEDLQDETPAPAGVADSMPPAPWAEAAPPSAEAVPSARLGMPTATGVAPGPGDVAPAAMVPPSISAVPSVRFAASSTQTAGKAANEDAVGGRDANPDVVYVTKADMLSVLFEVMGSALAVGSSSDQEVAVAACGEAQRQAPEAAELPMRAFGKEPPEAEDVCNLQASREEMNVPSTLDVPAWAAARAPAEVGADTEAEVAMVLSESSKLACVGSTSSPLQFHEAHKAVLCPSNHELLEFATPDDGWSCSMCATEFPTGRTLWGCRTCDYDVCGDCWEITRAATQEQTDNLAGPSLQGNPPPGQAAAAASVVPEATEAAADLPSAQRTPSGADFWRVPLPDLPDELSD